MNRQTTYRSKIFTDFRAIEPTEWRTIVRFYEEYEKEMGGLEFEEFFEILATYTNALFEIGDYQKHLRMADTVVEISVMNNVKFFNGSDIFYNTLFKKAASSFHLHQLEKADYILRELLRMDPRDTNCVRFLKKVLRQMRPAFVRRSRAAAMFLFLAAAFLICVEVLAVRSFYPSHAERFEAFRNTVLFAGFAVLAGGDLLHRWQVNREVDVFVAGLKRRKKSEK